MEINAPEYIYIYYDNIISESFYKYDLEYLLEKDQMMDRTHKRLQLKVDNIYVWTKSKSHIRAMKRQMNSQPHTCQCIHICHIPQAFGKYEWVYHG